MTPMLDQLDRSRTDVVLIVDDVPDNLSLLHDALDEAGYTVLVATHGEAALQRGPPTQSPGGNQSHPHRVHDRLDRDRACGVCL